MNLQVKLVFLFFLLLLPVTAQNRWTAEPDGGISWNVKAEGEHTDHIELSGEQISVILRYGVDTLGRLVSEKQLIFPMLRMHPNDTHGHLMYTFKEDVVPSGKVDGETIVEKAEAFYIKGMVRSVSDGGKVSVTRVFSPSVDRAVAVELFTLRNKTDKPLSIEIENTEKIMRTPPEKSVYGIYEVKASVQNAGIFTLQKGESLEFSMVYSGRKIDSEPITDINVRQELKKREHFIGQMFHNLQFVSPDTVLSRMFDFAKIRAAESIFATKGGLVHSPGGGNYYSAIWANDQGEYANPFFGYLGYDKASESAMVSWEWFSKWMNSDYKPIPSSIVAEGDSYWNGAGDRGDQAMIAYGAARFALALGDKEKARRLWPLIEWCLEYCSRKVNADGVVSSDSDELENRFPSGDANLCTSSLYYDALISAAYLGKDLNIDKKLWNDYQKKAERIRRNIESFFGANVQGFDTYRYYKENEVLRSWICIPLTVNIFERSEGTVDALFSPCLWTENGLLTQAGDKTFWDRSTLYGLRGAFAAGAIEKALPFFIRYSTRRLLGDHVPYAVEAWPEGGQRHLSAESALYCRVVTEGLFGFRPAGLNTFELTPQLPDEWNYMALKNMKAFGNKNIDISVDRVSDKIRTRIYMNGKLIKTYSGARGKKIKVQL